MLLNNVTDIKKAIKRTKFQRDSLFLSMIITQEDKEVLEGIYNQLIRKYKHYLAMEHNSKIVNNIKVNNFIDLN